MLTQPQLTPVCQLRSPPRFTPGVRVLAAGPSTTWLGQALAGPAIVKITMARSTATRKATRSKGPVSVPFPAELRRRTESFARQHNLQLATAVRLLVTERLAELEDDSKLSRVEEWQRAAAWATWEQLQSGTGAVAPRRQLEQIFTRARRAQARAAKPR